MSAGQRWRYRGAAASLVVFWGVLIFGVISPLKEGTQQAFVEHAPKSGEATTIAWSAWSSEKVREAVLTGKTVFVDFTADYCTVCKQNKIIAVNTAEVSGAMDELNVVAFQGDYSTGDPKIFRELRKHERAGVPLNLIYAPCRPDDPVVLPPTLTKGLLLDQLKRAGPSQVATECAEAADPPEELAGLSRQPS